MISSEIEAEVHRLFYIEHIKINAISQHLQIHRDTVQRALKTEKFINHRFRESILSTFEEYINETIELYPLIKAPRLRSLLQDRGYRGSSSTVRAYLRKTRRRIKVAYLRLKAFPGEQAQADWADFGTVAVEGGKRRLSCFVMVLSYSRSIFAVFCYDQTLESFLAYHIEAFEFFGGVPREILYDNLKNAVLEREAGHIRFNTNLLDLCKHYRFAPKACQPYAGNQKGRVERAIRYIRESFFEAREFKNLDKINEEMTVWLTFSSTRLWPDNKEKTVYSAFLEEQSVLIPLPEHSADPSKLLTARSGKTPYIRFDCNNYSIPHQFVGVTLSLRVNPSRITIYENINKVAEHARSWGKNQYIEDPKHIDDHHAQKKSHKNYRNRSMLLAKIPEAEALYPMWLERGDSLGNNSKRLLDLIEQYGTDAVKAAILITVQSNSPSVDSIALFLRQQSRPKIQRPTLNLPERLQAIEIKSHEPSLYDQLSH